MAEIIINATSYDAYVTVDEADAYLEGDFTATAWRAETDEDAKARAIVSASRYLDRLSWVGEKATPDQPLAWPRSGIDGIDDYEIPQQVLDACCLLAKYIHEGQPIETSQTTQSNVRRIKAGSVEQEFFYPFTLGTKMPMPVQDLLAGLLAGGSIVAGSRSYGTDGCPVSDDSYRLYSPF